MKTMKRLTALLLALVMLLALTACGDKATKEDASANTDGSTAAANDNPYNLDYKSDALQPMTDERASADVLSEAGEYYMHGLSSDPTNFTKTTYKDMAEHIGTDASEYQHFESWGQDRYTWYVEGSEGASLLAVFNTDGSLSMVTSSVG